MYRIQAQVQVAIGDPINWTDVEKLEYESNAIYFAYRYALIHNCATRVLDDAGKVVIEYGIMMCSDGRYIYKRTSAGE